MNILEFRTGLLLSLLAAVACTGPRGPKGEPGLDGVVDQPRGEDTLGGMLLVSEDSTWSQDRLLDGLVYVPEGVTLTIEGGVQIDLLPEAGLVVDGWLILGGNASSPVTFRDFALAIDDNNGVSVGGAPGSTLDHAHFDHVDLTVQNDPVDELNGLSFVSGGLNVRERTTPLTVRDLDASDGLTRNRSAISARDLPALTVEGLTGSELLYGVDFAPLQDGASLHVIDAALSQVSRAINSGTLGFGHHTVLVDGLTVTDASAQGVYCDDADVTLIDVTIQDTLYQGVLTGPRGGTLTLQDSLIERTGSMALQHQGDGLLQATGLTVRDIEYYGVYTLSDLEMYDSLVENTASAAVYSAGTAVVERTTLRNASYRGLWAGGDVTVTDLTVDGTTDYGIIVGGGGSITRCRVANAGIDGIYFYGDAPAQVSLCDVVDSAGYGIRGHSTLPHSLHVLQNNVTGSGSWGLLETGLAEGNYVADNLGLVGADLGEGGVEDGVRDTDTAQIQDADAILLPSATPVVGTGPQ